MNIKDLVPRPFPLGAHKDPEIRKTGITHCKGFHTKRQVSKAINDFYSRGYAKYFMENYLDAYIKYWKIDPKSEEGRALTALKAVKKLKGA